MFLTQKEASARLRISERHLIRLRNSGTLPAGSCWVRKIPTNPNSHVLYDLDACTDFFASATRALFMEQDIAS